MCRSFAVLDKNLNLLLCDQWLLLISGADCSHPLMVCALLVSSVFSPFVTDFSPPF
jgi:hypothetical protein